MDRENFYIKKAVTKTTCHVILFLRNGQHRQISRDRKQISGCQGLWIGTGWGVTGNGHEIFGGNAENVLKLDCADGSTTL